MNEIYLGLAALALFWAGIAVIRMPEREELRDRLGRFGAAAKSAGRELLPGSLVPALTRGRRRERMLQELSEALSYTRNIVILGGGGGISAQLLLEELSSVSRLLSRPFLDMAHYIHVNDRERAAAVLEAKLGEGYAADIGAFLAGWEDIAPEELLDTLEVYRSALREERLTGQLRRDELVSDLMYMPAVVNAMAVLLNFIYVAYFLTQREAFQSLFM